VKHFEKVIQKVWTVDYMKKIEAENEERKLRVLRLFDKKGRTK